MCHTISGKPITMIMTDNVIHRAPFTTDILLGETRKRLSSGHPSTCISRDAQKCTCCQDTESRGSDGNHGLRERMDKFPLETNSRSAPNPGINKHEAGLVVEDGSYTLLPILFADLKHKLLRPTDHLDTFLR